MISPKRLWSAFWLALKGVNPLTGRRLHPFQQRAIWLNLFMAVIGCIKLFAQLCLSRDQQRLLPVVLDSALSIAGIALALLVRERLLLKMQRQEDDRNG